MSGVYAALDISVSREGYVEEVRSQLARSFIRNFMRCLYTGFTGTDVNQYDTGGTARKCMLGGIKNIQPSGVIYYESGIAVVPLSGAGGATGIVVGSGNVPFDVDHNNLAAEIPHGSGVGSLYRGQTTFEQPAVSDDGQSATIRVSRAFSNASGSDITVNEIGLKGHPIVNIRDETAYVLYARDVLNTPIVVEPDRDLTVNYVMRTVL